MGDWRKKFREDTVKYRQSAVTSVSQKIVHNDLITILVLGTAAVFAVVLHLKDRTRDAEMFAIGIALPWILAAYRHSRTCRPCTRRSGG